MHYFDVPPVAGATTCQSYGSNKSQVCDIMHMVIYGLRSTGICFRFGVDAIKPTCKTPLGSTAEHRARTIVFPGGRGGRKIKIF